MHPVLTFLVGLAGGAIGLWLALFFYGLVRRNENADRRPGRRKILGLDSYGGDGGAD